MTATPHSSLIFDQVVEECSAQLLHYVERMVGDPELAEDLLQETLVKIARGLPSFEGRSSVKTWAHTIAQRVVADHFRKPDTRAQIVELDDDSAVVDADTDVGDRLVIGEMNTCVRQVIDSLPADFRSALVLHDLQGMTAAETAAMCECSLATAKIRIHRARRRLQAALQRECSFYRDRQDVLRCDREDG